MTEKLVAVAEVAAELIAAEDVVICCFEISSVTINIHIKHHMSSYSYIVFTIKEEAVEGGY